ncbi:MAG TPA: putative baseplate assembly protein [Lacunisphaera sp.]|jgi:hypothetical protein
MSLCCQQDERRDAVRRARGRNGLDYLEVSPDQLTLRLFFLGKLPPELNQKKPGLTRYLQLTGGQRVKDIRITQIEPLSDPDPEKDDQLVVTLDKYGDFSTYTLGLVGVAKIDPLYDHVDFTFKIDCPSDLDCAPVCHCEPPALNEPEINYLAKDYASFRQLMLDRLALLVPGWTERHVPDVGITLIEALAYTGDYLSYFQDAVATEAYLATARQRISVRRHARLVDYHLHEGCNARTWVCVGTDADFSLDPTDVAFITFPQNSNLPTKTIFHWEDLRSVPANSYEVFQPMALNRTASLQFYAAHSEIHFYTWGGKRCCLERGGTAATLIDTWVKEQPPAPPPDPTPTPQPNGPVIGATQPARHRSLNLRAGDVLIFEEVIGPVTANPADADPAKRHVLRLTKVTAAEDTLYQQPIVEIEWALDDALPFSVCLSAIAEAPECKFIENISVARGNVLLVDHGRSVGPENLGAVPTLSTEAQCECAGHPTDIQYISGRFELSLTGTPLTFSEPLPRENPARSRWTAATTLLLQDVRAALPNLQLVSQPSGNWTSRYDLFESEPGDRHFVVEVDDAGSAHLRFGDGELGFTPAAGTTFATNYRIGNGTSGNVGPESITLVVLGKTSINGSVITVRNPLAAQGGMDAEPVAEAKLFAPRAFRDPAQIQRAIIADDYALIAERNPAIQRAAAALVWTGSWYEADVAVDPLGSEDASGVLLKQITRQLRRFRRIGHDLHVKPAHYVPLDLQLKVCVQTNYQRGHVKAALLDVFGQRALPGGKRGFFHPDNLSFGEGIFLSKIIAAAQAVAGVTSVSVTRFHRLFESPNGELAAGVLLLRNDEIAQLDNDPNWPEHGKLEIQLSGGR